MYVSCGKMGDAMMVFDEMSVSAVAGNMVVKGWCKGENVVSWNAMISGLAFNGDGEKGCVGVGLVEMYVSCGKMGDAMMVFDEISVSAVAGNMVVKGWCKDGNVDMGLRKNKKSEVIPRAFFKHMQSLRVLDLYDTRITSLANSLLKLATLKVLYLPECVALVELHREIRNLQKLEVLDIRGNEVEVIFKIPMLKELVVDVEDGLERILYGEIVNIVRLTRLSLLQFCFSNKVVDHIKAMGGSVWIDVCSHPSRTIPRGIQSCGLVGLKTKARQMKERNKGGGHCTMGNKVAKMVEMCWVWVADDNKAMGTNLI
nr:hypothetical protein [Tanacetum cinerariifolium]